MAKRSADRDDEITRGTSNVFADGRRRMICERWILGHV
jgi:hypothetical protein